MRTLEVRIDDGLLAGSIGSGSSVVLQIWYEPPFASFLRRCTRIDVHILGSSSLYLTRRSIRSCLGLPKSIIRLSTLKA